MKITALVLFAIMLLAMVPFAIIWALNTLFALGLAYSFTNWLAVLILKLLVFYNNIQKVYT